MLRTGGPGLDNPGCIVYVVDKPGYWTNTESTISLQEEQKKRQVWCAQPVCLSHSLFFLFWGRETASQAQMYHLLKLPQLFLFFSPHLCNTLGSCYCCIQCMNPIPGRQTFTNQLCKVLHPYLPPETNICLCSTTVPAMWLHNFKSFSNQLNDGSYTVTHAIHLQPVSQRISPNSQQWLWK